jgi:hypothetical protein
MESARNLVRRIVFGITSILVVLLILRFFLILLNASSGHVVAQIITDLTNPLIQIFAGMFTAAGLGILAPLLEIIMAAIFFIFIGIFVASIINSFIQEHPLDILMEIIDTIFKLVEFVLIARLVLKLFGIDPVSTFVQFIYDNTGWVSGLLPAIDVLGGTLEFSTLFILVAVVIVDLGMEGFIDSIREKREGVGTTNHTTVIRENRPAPQNITINVPHQQQPVPVVRRASPQVINIIPSRRKR